MKTRRHGTIKQAIKKELTEERLMRIEKYLPLIFFIFFSLLMIGWCEKNYYKADLQFQSYAQEQSMNTDLWNRVMSD